KGTTASESTTTLLLTTPCMKQMATVNSQYVGTPTFSVQPIAGQIQDLTNQYSNGLTFPSSSAPVEFTIPFNQPTTVGSLTITTGNVNKFTLTLLSSTLQPILNSDNTPMTLSSTTGVSPTVVVTQNPTVYGVKVTLLGTEGDQPQATGVTVNLIVCFYAQTTTLGSSTT
ncbi:unnamed protein product, partial [Didymodactylos carnosus]